MDHFQMDETKDKNTFLSRISFVLVTLTDSYKLLKYQYIQYNVE